MEYWKEVSGLWMSVRAGGSARARDRDPDVAVRVVCRLASVEKAAAASGETREGRDIGRDSNSA
jgi:hypothetical protein